MRKTLSFVVVVIISLCFIFAGFLCFSKNEPEFKTVSYVRLVSGGKEINRYSVASPINKKIESSSKSECEKASFPYNLSAFGGLSFSDKRLGDSKTIDSYSFMTEEDIGCYVYWGNNKNPFTGEYLEYVKCKFMGWTYSYVHVKVVNDQKLIVYSDSNLEVNQESLANATTYEVTSYQIGIVYD